VLSPEESARWVADARERGLPVFATGVLLLAVLLEIPVLVAAVLVLLPMLMVQVWAARRMFPMPEHDAGPW